MSIFEKAITKLYGNYKHLNEGTQSAAMYALSGMHTRSFIHKEAEGTAGKETFGIK